MSSLIIIRLHPAAPMSADDFRNALTGLTVAAYDRAFDQLDGVPLGTATGLADAPPSPGIPLDDLVDITAKGIIQHFTTAPAGPPPEVLRTMEAVATAVIVPNPPAGHPEYPGPESYDLKLVLTRGADTFPDLTFDYNIVPAPDPGPGPLSQETYTALAASAYATVPPAAPAAFTLPADGTPPAFKDLVKAVDAVLALDPGGTDLASHAQLTRDECDHLAAELIWDRTFDPPPAEPADYADGFTQPPQNSDAPTDLQKFQGQQASYYATNNAQTGQLSGFIFTASAAIACERLSLQATRAGFPFPLLTGQPGTPLDTEVLLTASGPALSPDFGVPAAFFYALATSLSPLMDAGQRFDLARYAPEQKVVQQLAAADESGVIDLTDGFSTGSAGTLTADQAARRLDALGSVQGSLPQVVLAAPVTDLVSAWLAHTGPTATIDADFWAGEVAAHESAYLNLVLQVITGNYTPLMNAITDPAPGGLGVATVGDLVAVTDQTWHDTFIPAFGPPNISLLPPFTQPGTPAERVAAFLRYLHRFFTVPATGVDAKPSTPGAPGTLGVPQGDVFASFITNYATEGGGAFAFGTAWDATALAAAVVDTLPGDPAAQQWLTQALNTIEALYRLTAFAPDAQMHFSLMEALYARGFVDDAGVQALSPDDFQAALTGSIAYPYAAQIQAAAGGSTAPTPPVDSGFAPINPDGSLTDCVPPHHLSPFGPVAYLAELLLASAASTLEQPVGLDPAGQFGTLLASRRGPLGTLHATRANLDTPVPVIDLVNESLEALAAAVASGGPVSGGAVFDTEPDDADSTHSGDSYGDDSYGDGDGREDAAKRLAAIPQHSSPACVDVPDAETAAYATLRDDFTAPGLPYDQPLDVNRSYLCELGTSRFATMRRFRKEITEFVLDPAPADEPPEFQRHVWRYPVRLELALEYLCISAAEYATLYQSTPANTDPAAGREVWRLYGFPAEYDTQQVPWQETVSSVPQFLARTGLDYCAFLDLQRCGYVPFTRAQSRDTNQVSETAFPDCEPCSADELRIELGDTDQQTALFKLIVFIRLWRSLRCCGIGKAPSFQELADLCTVLGLFAGSAPDPDFPRQLAAEFMLRDDLRLPPAGRPAGTDPADRDTLLALWATPTPPSWDAAVRLLLDGVERHARARYDHPGRGPEFRKVLGDNLDTLSALAGFDPGTASDTWHARPTHTLRFAEVLGKIYASRFTVGELEFLFTVDPHLDGDDPFPLPDDEESCDDPFALPESEPTGGDGPHSLWALRSALLEVHEEQDRDQDGAGEEDPDKHDGRDDDDHDRAAARGWRRIVAALHEEFGYTSPTSGPDPLTALAEHFFPSVLEAAGQTVDATARRYQTPLAAADTSPLMWTAEAGPFGYDRSAEQLTLRLPLRDRAVIDRLRELRPLNAAEQAAVRELYFAPRAALAPFAALFDDFGKAVDHLVREPDEQERFAFFRRQFDRYRRRCAAIADHLARHVGALTGCDEPDSAAAWRVLRALHADENFAVSPWEDDSGRPPEPTWQPRPSGDAFSALLGLAGTGLLGEYRVGGGDLVWRETRGPLTAFGRERDAHNAPVPTVLPALDLALRPDQLRFVGVRNGFALRDRDGEPLGGAQPFSVRWSGALLIEQHGEYRFHAHAQDCDAWRVTLRRGQRTWTLLSHGTDHARPGAAAPSDDSAPLRLHRGVYRITVEYERREPEFDNTGDIRPTHAGFRLDYTGPDTEGERRIVPNDKLFLEHKDSGLGAGLTGGGTDTDANAAPAHYSGSAAAFLDGQYVSSLRDIRRTYQRAVKALLFAERFRLSARPVRALHESELGYFLDHPSAFAGTCHHRTGPNTFGTHHAWFAPDLLPVADPCPPQPAADQRAAPSPQRRAALFDIWERVFDYCHLREATGRARERPAWLLFSEVSEQQPDEPAELLRHLGVDLRHGPLVLTYFASLAQYPIAVDDLADERWAVRVWHAETWLRRLAERFGARDITAARPDLWASDDPSAPLGAPPVSGNANLTTFVQDGCLARTGVPRRYEPLRRLNDCLRERARAALIAYLCGMDRVALPWTSGSGATLYARDPRDLSDLLLQDVECGIGQRESRVEDAVCAVQTFVQRARLGLEPACVPGPWFTGLWDRRFADLRTWQACRRHEAYPENWAEWGALRAARRNEAFRYLEDGLRRASLTVAVPGGAAWWPGTRPPQHCALPYSEVREPALIQLLNPAVEGLGLLGTPERANRPSWLAPLMLASTTTNQNPNGGGNGGDTPPPLAGPRSRRKTRALAAGPDTTTVPVGATATTTDTVPPSDATTTTAHAPDDRLPLWFQAAVRLGTRFVRVAAAGLPPASAAFAPRPLDDGCCDDPPPVVDEYYFWLADAEFFPDLNLDPDTAQDADAGISVLPDSDQTSAWEQPDKLPAMLVWKPAPMVHLYWSRVHHGEFETPGRSSDGLPTDGTVAQLVFKGRLADSLHFDVTGGVAPTGSTPAPSPGFRYDIADDSAAPLPQPVPVPDPPTSGFPGGLPAYPFFAYVSPGAPVEPLSPTSVAFAVAAALRTRCRPEDALKWYELAYAPLNRDNTWTLPAVAPDRAVLLAYLETLLQWGESALCRGSYESNQRAGVIFETLERILGRRPCTVLTRGEAGATAPTVADFEPAAAPLNPRLLSLYDRTADRLALVRDDSGGRRLRNRALRRDAAFWNDDATRDGWREPEPACCGDGYCDEPECRCCRSPYRFTNVLQKALELTNEARALSSALLAAYEKGDAEALAALRVTHERQIAELTLAVRQYAWREADWQVQALSLSKQNAQAKLRYYVGLLAGGLNAGESGYEVLSGSAMQLHSTANASEAISQAMNYIPDIATGVAGLGPYFATTIPLGTKIANSFAAAAQIFNTEATISGVNAGLNLTEGGWDRRTAEWQLQVETLGIEIAQIQRQILAAERHRDSALRELDTHQRQIEHDTEVRDFLRDKFTSDELYLYLQQETAGLHRRMYDLALHTAAQAQRAYNYERGYTVRGFLPQPGWDDLHEGLTAADRLHVALRRMESAYRDSDCREYELTKHVSLRLDFPLAFLKLRETGRAEIEIPEWMFDLDYPGQYLRRIKNVTLTLPCVVGPYTGVHCKLTLLGSTTRIDPRLACPPSGCCDERRHDHGDRNGGCRCGDRCREGCRCVCDGDCGRNGNTGGCACGGGRDGAASYDALPDDPRLVRVYTASEAIATSSGQNDSGLFELSFHDERYLPFEFAGAVSRWRVELPPENNRFDLDSLTDVVLHVGYTAREGGEALRRAAGESARGRLPGAGLRLFEARRDLPDEWDRLRGRHPAFALRLGRAHFPYVPFGRDVRITRTELYFELEDADCRGDLPVRFVAEHEAPHGQQDECGCHGIVIDCAAVSHCPALYRGVLDLPLGPLDRHGPRDLGEFRFDLGPGRPRRDRAPLRRMFVVCAYETDNC